MSTMSHDEAVRKLAEKIKDIKFAMLATVERDGSIRSRPMATQETKFDGTLWFFTGASSGKVGEIRNEEHVNLSYASPDDQRYVSVSGRATVVKDRDRAKELWNPIYKAWFPGGLDDPDLALLRVEVDRAEYWDSPSAPVTHILGFAKAIVTGERLEKPGENEKLNLR